MSLLHAVELVHPILPVDAARLKLSRGNLSSSKSCPQRIEALPPIPKSSVFRETVGSYISHHEHKRGDTHSCTVNLIQYSFSICSQLKHFFNTDIKSVTVSAGASVDYSLFTIFWPSIQTETYPKDTLLCMAHAGVRQQVVPTDSPSHCMILTFVHLGRSRCY